MVCGYMIGLENCEHAVKLKKRFSIELIENNVIVNDIEVFPASIIKNLRCNEYSSTRQSLGYDDHRPKFS